MADINTRHLNDIIATTLERFKDNLGNYLTRGNPFLAYLKSKSHIEKFNGGTEQRETFVKSGTNVNVFDAYTELPVANKQFLGTARFPFCNLETHYTMSFVEERENKGEYAVIKLVRRKLEIALESLKNEVDRQLFGVGGVDASGKPTAIQGIGYIVADDPTKGVMGDIDRSLNDNAKWRNVANTVDSITPNNIYKAIKNIVRDCDYKTDLIIAGADMYDAYEDYLQTQKRICQQKSIVIGDAAFNGLEYDNIPVLPFKNCPPKRIYALNMKNMYFHVDEQAYFTQIEGHYIPNTVNDYWYPIVIRCALSTNDPTMQGVVLPKA